MARRASAFLLAVVSLGILGGCGYRMVSYPQRADAGRVAIQNFDNESFDYGYEFVLADAMRKEFARRGAWRLVNDPANAEVVINGAISPIDTGRRSFSSVVSTLEYEVGVVLRLDVERPGDLQLGVDSRVLRERELYLASADVEVTRRNRDEALRRVASTLAKRVHDVLYEVAPPTVGGTRPKIGVEFEPDLTPGAEPLEPGPPGELPPLPEEPPAMPVAPGTPGAAPVETEGVGESAEPAPPPRRSPLPSLEDEDPFFDGRGSE